MTILSNIIFIESKLINKYNSNSKNNILYVIYDKTKKKRQKKINTSKRLLLLLIKYYDAFIIPKKNPKKYVYIRIRYKAKTTMP